MWSKLNIKANSVCMEELKEKHVQNYIKAVEDTLVSNVLMNGQVRILAVTAASFKVHITCKY